MQLPAFLVRGLAARLLPIAQRRPADVVIRPDETPNYLHRWHLARRRYMASVYLHNQLADDSDAAMHDHPWWNVSIILAGGYWEYRPRWPLSYPEMLAAGVPREKIEEAIWRGPGSVILRRAQALHRLVLDDGDPSWSLFLTGPKVRSWGFQCPKGWRHWRVFTTPGDSTRVGAGCGEA